MTNAVPPSPTVRVNPSTANLEALASVPDPGPIIMLNLLRFAEPDGRAAYGRYTAVARGTVQATGGSVPYMGQAVLGGEEHGGWDTAILVRYPRRAAYLKMQSDAAYVGAIPDRTAGLAARLITPFHEPGGDPEAPFTVESSDDGEAFVVALSDEKLSVRSSKTVLELQADMSMVTDHPWQLLTLLRFPSLAAAQNARPPVAPLLWLVTQP